MAASFTGKPDMPGQCWAMRSISYGAMYSSVDNCRRRSRPGKLTCRTHDYLEEEAQERKAKHQKEVGNV